SRATSRALCEAVRPQPCADPREHAAGVAVGAEHLGREARLRLDEGVVRPWERPDGEVPARLCGKGAEALRGESRGDDGIEAPPEPYRRDPRAADARHQD